MGGTRLRIGEVELLALVDVERVEWPHALGPDVPAEAWEPHRRRHPSVFGAGDLSLLPIVCFLVCDADRFVLVRAGCGPASLPLPRRLGVTRDAARAPARARLGRVEVERGRAVWRSF